jgi:uncharacterized protein (DUF1330 family)
MAKGYWIANVDVTNPDSYKNYVAANAAPLKKYGAKFLTRGGKAEHVEGKLRARVVVLEFPSYQAALDCYHSPEYQAAVKLRAGASNAELVVLEGYDGPQP